MIFLAEGLREKHLLWTNRKMLVDNAVYSEGSNTTYTGESQALIHCNQNTVGNEQNCDSSLINNCTFTGGAYGIYTRAYALSGRRMYNNKYINNTFKNQNKQ